MSIVKYGGSTRSSNMKQSQLMKECRSIQETNMTKMDIPRKSKFDPLTRTSNLKASQTLKHELDILSTDDGMQID
jgi:hypothetical protein